MPTLFLTGGSGEIGSAIIKKFASQHFEIIAPSHQELDLSNNTKIENFMKNLGAPIHVFVHCAGFNTPKPAGTLSQQELETTMQINSLSFYQIIFHLLNHFKQLNHGHILGISSLYGEFSRKNRLAYAASKHALNGMIKTLALELGSHNIQVNGVAPGFIDTKMTRKNNDAAMIDNFKRKIPLGRLGTPEDIANISYFLCSNENTYINGQIITVDGGYSQGGFQE